MKRKWWTLVLISIATFMLLLDITVVNVALPDSSAILIAAVISFAGAALGFLLVRSRDFVQPTDGASAASG